MLTGYHTIEDRGNPDEIESEGPFLCKREDAWLGNGYYFWDTKFEWAHQWGEKAYKTKGYVICRADLEDAPSVMYDLFGNVAHQEEFEEMIELLKADRSYSRAKPLVSEILAFLQRQNLFPYRGIRAADNYNKVIEVDFRPPRSAKKPENRPYMRVGQRVQICLIEKSNLTLRNFTIVYPEKYLFNSQNK